MFLFLAFSATQVANYTAPNASIATSPNASNLLFVSLAFGFSLAVNAWVFFRITGGLFNPAVSVPSSSQPFARQSRLTQSTRSPWACAS